MRIVTSGMYTTSNMCITTDYNRQMGDENHFWIVFSLYCIPGYPIVPPFFECGYMPRGTQLYLVICLQAHDQCLYANKDDSVYLMQRNRSLPILER